MKKETLSNQEEMCIGHFERELEEIIKINRIDEALKILNDFKTDKRFPSNHIDNEIAYLKKVQQYFFKRLIGAHEVNQNS